MRAVFPWPGHGDRRAAVDRARAQRRRSQEGAAHAAAITSQIERMAAENHFAAAIADQIIRRHQGEQ